VPIAEKHLDLEIRRPPARVAPGPMLRVIELELERSMRELRSRAKAAPYYLSYDVADVRSVEVAASLGALVSSSDDHIRSLDVDIRVGSPELDNTRLLRGEDNQSHYVATHAWLPLDDDPESVRSRLWLYTHRDYERAMEDLVRVKANQEIKVAQEDTSADFSQEKPIRLSEAPASLVVDRKAWETRVKGYSGMFTEYAEVHTSSVEFSTMAETRYFANSEGSGVQVSRVEADLTVSASATAADGMHLERREVLSARSAQELPSDETIRATVRKVIEDVRALRRAPQVEPFTGPAILDGRAAAVFFHEIFGHRVEGQRQKNEEEGQTFTRKIGQRILPEFLNVYDDPTVFSLNRIALSGHYLVDDEGVPAERAPLIQAGVFTGFLMSRSPIRGFARSNGHGRRELGYRAVARQGNLIVDPSRTTTPQGLKQLLLEEISKQHKPFGLRFTEIVGGFTNTSRGAAQAFKVLPVMVYKVFPNGSEELVRGGDLEGTPLTVLSRIIAAANDFQVFNGVCGAESGWVPVSAVSPSLLLSQIEVARRQKEQDRPPLLPPPMPPHK
jgi:predicted Zn-dependent protease